MGDFYLPTDYTAGMLTLNVRAFVIVPEPSRALLVALGLSMAVLRRRRE